MGKSIKELNEEIGGLAERAETTERTVTMVAETVNAVLERFQNLETLLAGMSAQHRPVATDHGKYDAQEFYDPNAEGVVEPGEGSSLVKPKIMDVDSPAFREKEERLAFERELLDIYIQETSEKQADPVFQVGVNGRQWTFWRGHRYTVPRYVVGVLASAKPVTFGNEEFTSNDGVRGIRWPARRGLRYGFAVERDPSGDRGRAWLKAILAAA